MANSIERAKKYVPMLDEVFKKASTSSILERANVMQREGANVHEVLLPSVTTQKLGDYGRNTGYAKGDSNFSWQTYSLTQDRGRQLSIDRLDNTETLDMPIGAMTSDFIRTGVVPEVDAYRYAQLSSLAGNSTSGTLTADTVLSAIDTAIQTFQDSEVPVEGSYLFVTPTIHNLMKNSSKLTLNFDTKGQDGINRRVSVYDNIPVVIVPQSRFYTEITLNDGTTAGQEDGGYTKGATGKDINFMLVHANSAMPVTRLAQPKLHNPDDVVGLDSWVFEYRIYHDIIVPNNKVNGVYLHHVA